MRISILLTQHNTTHRHTKTQNTEEQNSTHTHKQTREKQTRKTRTDTGYIQQTQKHKHPFQSGGIFPRSPQGAPFGAPGGGAVGAAGPRARALGLEAPMWSQVVRKPKASGGRFLYQTPKLRSWGSTTFGNKHLLDQMSTGRHGTITPI